MSVSLLTEIRRNQVAQHTLSEAPSLGNSSSSLLVRASLDGLSDERNPSMENTVFQAAERLTESHVADNVKGGKVYGTCQLDAGCLGR